jgi:hypothetical protein
MAEHDTTDFTDPVQRDAFGHWLSGFVDGEGSFNLTNHRPTGHSVVCTCSIAIEVRCDELPTLEMIRKYFGVGAISFRDFAGRSNRTARFQCQRHFELVESVITHFDRFPLRAKKRHDYVFWREAVILWHQVAKRKQKMLGFPKGQEKKWKPHEVDRFLYLRESMIDGRKFRPPATPICDIAGRRELQNKLEFEN